MNSNDIIVAAPKFANDLILFVVLTVIFHLVFVVWLKLNKMWWKVADYIWLGLAVLGIIGATGEVRKAIASQLNGAIEMKTEFALQDASSIFNSFAAKPGAVCRTFVRSQYSPPEEEMQKTQQEYNLACDWITQAASVLSAMRSLPPEEIKWSMFPPKPKFDDESLKQIFAVLDIQINLVNQQIAELERTRTLMRRTALESWLLFASPILLAFSLALRITKVTGEIILEYKAKAKSAPQTI